MEQILYEDFCTSFLNLRHIYNLAANKFNQYDGNDFILPQSFKEQVKEINGNSITYNDYSVIIRTKGYQRGYLNIFLPNQWFYIASYFTDFYNELMQYRRLASQVTTKERLKVLDKGNLTYEEKNKLQSLEINETSKTYLARFITNYEWWHGAKSIDRGDFYVSPILACACLVNASQSYIAELCAFLSDKQELAKLIVNAADVSCNERKISEDYKANSFTYYHTAMRTKPFLLLAGISGTGKSRIVKQMAFGSCPDIEALRKDPTSPGNYQLIEVKPNWHDSTEVLGYESEIGAPHYVLTPFIRFLVKAMLYEAEAPFFVCMDEMNLAPVEQYFAEFLSVLESRKLIDGRITSEPLIRADIFIKYENQMKRDLFNLPKEQISSYDNTTSDTPAPYGNYNTVYDRLKEEGLRLPSNLIVVGTVNMDETTHQFSRKVIDRAMTIEMNIEDAEAPFKDFFNGSDALQYYENPQLKELFLPKVVQAADALTQLSGEDVEYIKANVPQLLYRLNQALDSTPFKIAYRVQNELVLYFYALREEQPDADAETLLTSAMDAILMMKVLPRIEGDEDLLEKPLKSLATFTEAYPQASKKIIEMQQRLPQAHFTSFWP